MRLSNPTIEVAFYGSCWNQRPMRTWPPKTKYQGGFLYKNPMKMIVNELASVQARISLGAKFGDRKPT